MKMSFTTECQNTYGIYTFYAYVGYPKTNLPINEGANYLRSCEKVLCCFDTGANHTSISKRLYTTLNLPIHNCDIHIQSINTHTVSDELLAGICLPNNFVIASIPVCVVDFGVNPVELNIGMDIISLGTLSLYHKENNPILSFSVDSRHHGQ